MQNKNLSDIRNEYIKGELDPDNASANPYGQFGKWLGQAIEAGIGEPNAMTLATVGNDGKPRARIVLLKGFDEKGFRFFTNYESHKGNEISGNHHVALVFFWKELERQVRIEGFAIKLAAEDSDAYFYSRPAESQVSAIVSPQSTAIPDRLYLDNLREAYKREHTAPYKRPAYWGGYLVVPDRFEFWQGRMNRFHDRISYTRKGNQWLIQRLAP